MNKKNWIVRSALSIAALLAAANLAAQTLRVTAANSSAGSAVYDVVFDPPGTTLLNSDGATLGSVHAIAFVPGTSSGVDLIVADTQAGAAALQRAARCAAGGGDYHLERSVRRARTESSGRSGH